MFRTIILIVGVNLMLGSCTSMKLKPYKNNKPAMNLKEYFNGPIKAWGIIQNWRGEVISRFDVDMKGSWEGDIGTLKEQFVYYDSGEKQNRTWTIKKLSELKYEGTADDILDKAEGEISGNAMRWVYKMDLPVDGSTYRITFDDWMWVLNDGIVINRSYLKKFGFTVAELTLFMQKQDLNK